MDKKLDLFVKQDGYTKKWHIYSAPFTPVHHAGKMLSFTSKADAEAYLREGQ